MLDRTLGLYTTLLGDELPKLGASVARLHATSEQARGFFRVRRGGTWLARLIGAILRMPPAGDRTAVELNVARRADRERWERKFGGHPLVSVQWSDGGHLVESMGLFQCWFRLRAERGSLVFEQVRASVGLRGFSLPLPRWLSPRIEGRADMEEGDVRVEVHIHAPVAGLLVAYDGKVTPSPPLTPDA